MAARDQRWLRPGGPPEDTTTPTMPQCDAGPKIKWIVGVTEEHGKRIHSKNVTTTNMNEKRLGQGDFRILRAVRCVVATTGFRG